MKTLSEALAAVTVWRTGGSDTLQRVGKHLHSSLEVSRQFRTIVFIDKSLQAILECTSISQERRIRAGNALVEVLTNIVQHGAEENDQPVYVDFYVQDNLVAVCVQQFGQGFDASQASIEMPDVSEFRGRGLAIVAAYCDGLGFSGDGRTCLFFLEDKDVPDQQ